MVNSLPENLLLRFKIQHEKKSSKLLSACYPRSIDLSYCIEPYAQQNIKARTGGGKGRHLWPRLVQKIAEGKTSYALPGRLESKSDENNN